MKYHGDHNQNGFTLSEMLVALSIAAIALLATISSSVGLQKSLGAVDNYFNAHVQQIRIVDFLSRDVKRSYIVTSTGTPQTVTCMIPTYLDSTGKRQTPTIKKTGNNGIVVDYGTKTFSDAATTNGSAIVTSPTANFTASDVGKSIAGTGIPPGATVLSRTSATSITMSAPATATASVQAVIGASTVLYSINNQSILRTENGVLTTIASSTDNLLPNSVDVTLSNTEYLQTSITFLPIFTSLGATTRREGTTLYSTAYLRNKRRG